MMPKMSKQSPREPSGLKRVRRHDHRFTLASLALLGLLLVAGLTAWVAKNPGTAVVDPRPAYAGHGEGETLSGK